MSIGRMANISIVVGLLAALVTALKFLSKTNEETEPQADHYGGWEDSLGV